MKNDTEQDELWNVMGKVRRQEASGHFTQDVLRAVRQEAPSSSWNWVMALRRLFLPVSALAFGSILALGLLNPSNTSSEKDLDLVLEAFEQPPTGETLTDFKWIEEGAILGELDQLIAMEDTQDWVVDTYSF